MAITRRPRLGHEAGASLIDVLVTMIITMLLGGLVLTMAVSTYRASRYSNQDTGALAALRTAMDRLEREVRQAQLVYSTSTATTLKFWVDTDLDHTQDTAERVTWAVSNPSGTTAHLTRTTDAGGTPAIVTRELLWNSTFAYFAYNTDRSVVTLSYIADLDPQSLAPQRSVSTDVTLRNLNL
ncbi:MAG: PulJ/GspJ family protein [Actinomycetota bacterium]